MPIAVPKKRKKKRENVSDAGMRKWAEKKSRVGLWRTGMKEERGGIDYNGLFVGEVPFRSQVRVKNAGRK